MNTNGKQKGNGAATLDGSAGVAAGNGKAGNGVIPGTRKLAVCPQCHVLFRQSEESCPACGAGLGGDSPAGEKAAGRSRGLGAKVRRRKGEGNAKSGVILPERTRKAERSRKDRGTRNGNSNGKKASTSKQKATGDGGRLSGLRQKLPSFENSRRNRTLAAAALAIGLAAGGYFLLVNDPEAEVARKALDRSRPATVTVVSQNADATNLKELIVSGNDAGKAGVVVSDQQKEVAALESPEYRKVAGNDLAAQDALLEPYAAVAAVNRRKVSSRKLRALGRAVKRDGRDAAALMLASQAAVDRVGALEPDAQRPRFTERRLKAAVRRTGSILSSSAAEIAAWEQSVDAWRKRQAERKAQLAAYQEQAGAALGQYANLRSELQKLDENELDDMTMPEAEEALQSHHDQRVDALNRLVALTPPASIASVHDQLAETVRQGVDGLDNAITAMGDQGDVTIGLDPWTDEEVLFGTYFRDEPAWQNYRNTSETNTERMNQLKPEWEQATQGEQQRINASKPPQRPTI